jgi:hypothetical protein
VAGPSNWGNGAEKKALLWHPVGLDKNLASEVGLWEGHDHTCLEVRIRNLIVLTDT